jgi:hypothetical protein
MAFGWALEEGIKERGSDFHSWSIIPDLSLRTPHTARRAADMASRDLTAGNPVGACFTPRTATQTTKYTEYPARPSRNQMTESCRDRIIEGAVEAALLFP